MKRLLFALLAVFATFPAVLAGHMAWNDSGMWGGGYYWGVGMIVFKVLAFVLGAFIFSAIFWYTKKLMFSECCMKEKSRGKRRKR